MQPHSESLARFPLFRSLQDEAIRRLDQSCAWRRATAGEWVLDYQDQGTDLFFVLHGHVRVTIVSAGREIILRDIRDGEFFGELAAIDGKPRSAGIVAVSDTVVARMSSAVFRATLHGDPGVCDQILMLLASQIRMLANRVNEYSNYNVRQRIHMELLRLARPAQSGKTEAVISPPPTHAELAARVSTHREGVTRELKALERAQLITRRRGALVLLDPVRLKRMAQESD